MSRHMRGVIVLLGIAMLTVAGVAQAQLYGRVDTGYSWSRNVNITINEPGTRTINDVGNSWLIGAGVGYRLNENQRLDVTLGYRGNYNIDLTEGGEAAKADVKSWNLMFNGYLDMSIPSSSVKPYIGVGIGYANNKVGDMTLTSPVEGTATVPGGTKHDFAWCLMAGVSVPLQGKTTVEIGYRYIDLGKVEMPSASITTIPGPGRVDTLEFAGASGRLKAHELTIGIRF